MTKTDPKGSVSWNRVVQTNISVLPLSMSLASGQYEIIGLTSSKDVNVVRIDADGQVTENTRLTLGAEGVQFAVFQVAANGHLIAAGEKATAGAGSQIYVARIDRQGKTLLEHTIEKVGSDESPSRTMTASNGDLVVLGSVSAGGSVRSDRNLLVVRLQADGTEVWSREWGIGTVVESGNDIIESRDGSLVIVGDEAPAAPGFADAYVVRLDRDGSEMWSRVFERGDYRWSEAVSALAVSDGFIVAGNIGQVGPGARQRIFVMKVDSSGNYVPLPH
jgi:hypothetical protein